MTSWVEVVDLIKVNSGGEGGPSVVWCVNAAIFCVAAVLLAPSFAIFSFFLRRSRMAMLWKDQVGCIGVLVCSLEQQGGDATQCVRSVSLCVLCAVHLFL